MTDAELTAIYNEANGIVEGKNPPISTQRIFAAMRLAAAKERERCAQVCEGERVKAVPKSREDEFYNLATDHVAAAIRRLT